MKIKRKRKLSHTSLKRHHPTTNMALTAALLHSPSTHNRAEGVRGRRYRLEIQNWSLNFKRSRDEEMQTKRHLQRAFHTSESIEGPGKRKGTFEGRRRDRLPS